MGINAAPVMSPLLLTRDAHLQERNNYITVEHDVKGSHLTTRPTWRFKSRTELPARSGPTFGADSRSILESLGYSEAEIGSMVQRRITAKTLI